MIKAIIFDINGIFVKSRKLSDRFQEDFGVPTSTFLPKLSEIMDKVRRPGAGKAFDYWSPVFREWNVHFSEQEFWDYWFKAEIPSEQMIKFAKSLRDKGIRVFILSNNFMERIKYYNHYPWIHEAVDKVYFSGATGLVKPDPGAWELVLSENGLKSDECLYFDDKEKNLKVAESIGIKAFMFTDEKELERIVVGYLDAQ